MLTGKGSLKGFCGRGSTDARATSLAHASFEVDLASVDPRPQIPFNDPFPVNIYNPDSRAVERSAVADLFRRRPIRTTLVRAYSDETTEAEALRRAVERALYRRESSLAEAGPLVGIQPQG